MSRKLNSSKVMKYFPAFAAGLVAIISPAISLGQAVARVTEPVKDSALVTLKGSVHPLARAEFDRGPVSDSQSGKMLLVLKRSTEQDQALRQLIEDQQTAGSPNFHKWLTPEQFGERFGVADADVQAVTGYLQQNGFTVGRVYKNKSAIEVSGTAGQLRATFHTQIHKYEIDGTEFTANANNPKIPAALAPVVRGFAALNNIKSLRTRESMPQSISVKLDAEHHRMSPDYTGNVGAGVFYLLAPTDLQSIYDLPVATSDNGKGGTGATVGVIGDSQVNLDLIARYQSLGGSGKTTPTEIVDGSDPGIVAAGATPDTTADALIAYEQLELIGAAAPYANINYYVSLTTDYDTGLDFAMIRAVEDNAVQVLTMGFQTCEGNLTAIGNELVESSWLQASAQGITVVVAAGDTGAGACDVPGSAASTGGLAVNGYASTPYNVAVGGTDFFYNNKTTGAAGTPTTPTQYWNATNSSTFGSVNTATLPIPEQPWNGSIQSNDYVASPTLPVADWAGGGGFSTLGSVASDDTTESPYPVPSWQTTALQNSLIPNPKNARALPDVAFFAGNDYNAVQYAICAAPGDCNGTFSNTTTLTATIMGGTAGSAAVFAGLMADVVVAQNAQGVVNGPQGNVTPELYNLATSRYSATNKTGVYHDVTAGYFAATHPLSNSVICTIGAGCNTGTDGTGNKYLTANATYAYTAGTGYDLATGLGSIDGKNLVASWGSPATLNSTTVVGIDGKTSGASIVHGTPIVISAAVKSSGTPTGNVAFTTSSGLTTYGGLEADPLVSSSTLTGVTCPTGFSTPCQIATDAAYTAIAPGDIINLPSGTTFLPGGSYNLYARYAGDGNNLPSVSSPFAITVTPEPSRTFIYSRSYASGSSVVYGTKVNITAEPFSLNNVNVSTPTGTLSLYSNSNDPMLILPLSTEGTATFSSNLLTGGNYNMIFGYSGDPSYLPSTTASTPYTLTVTQAPTGMTLAATNSISSNQQSQLTAVVTPTTPAPTSAAQLTNVPPTGTVVFTNAYNSQTVALAPGFSTASQGTAVASLAVTPINPITNTLAPDAIGIVTDGTTSTYGSGFDGVGDNYSANLLGPSLVFGGKTYFFGTANLNNITRGISTAAIIKVPTAIYSNLSILGAGVFGSQTNQVFTINYSDGSTQQYTQSLSDWGNPQNFAGEATALTMPYRISPTGAQSVQNYYLYQYSFTPSATKSVVSLTLPANTQVELVAITGTSNAAQNFTATYSGDADYQSSAQSTTVAGNNTSYANSSALTISLSNNPVAQNGTLTLTATTTQTTGTPNGTVQVYANGVAITNGSFKITSTSATNFVIPTTGGYLPFSSGPVVITAVFTPGTPTVQPSSASTNLTVTDDRVVADFSISTDTQQQNITSSSNVAFFNVQLSSIANFAGANDPIGVTCSIPGTTGLKCTLSANSVYIGTNGTAFLQARISGSPSTVTSSALHAPSQPEHWWLLGGGSALACVFILGIPARRKGWHGMIAVLVCAILITTSIAGCGNSNLSTAAVSAGGQAGGGGASPNVSGNFTGGLAASTVTAGSYKVIFTGTATSNTKLTHNTAVTVNVTLYNGTGSTGLALIDGGSYVFTNFNSALLLTDYGASTAPNNGLTQYSADGASSKPGLDQQWIFTYQGHTSGANSGNPGYYTIQNAASGLFLTDPGGAFGTNTQVTQAAALTDGSQYWTLNTLEGGFELVNAESGGVLDDLSFGTTNGTQAICYQQKTLADALNQQWTIAPVTP